MKLIDTGKTGNACAMNNGCCLLKFENGRTGKDGAFGPTALSALSFA